MLSNMTLHFTSVGQVMVFCIDHSDAHRPILDMIISSITSPGILLQDKLPRFYLLHDILHNCSVSVTNANELEILLPFVFQHFGIVWRRIESRLRAEAVKKMVMQVIDLWEHENIYSEETCMGYRQSFLLERPRDKESEEEDLDGVPLEHDLEGLPLNDDLDGVPLDHDLDGMPLEIMPDPELDGEPLDMSLFQ
jgi:U2-associated protein SR140